MKKSDAIIIRVLVRVQAAVTVGVGFFIIIIIIIRGVRCFGDITYGTTCSAGGEKERSLNVYYLVYFIFVDDDTKTNVII